MSNQAFVASLADDGISAIWNLPDELTVHQAALLTVEIDPSSEIGSNCTGWASHERPRGYEAAIQGISSALRNGLINGKNIEEAQGYWNGELTGYISSTTERQKSSVNRDSLVRWFKSKGLKPVFFFTLTTDLPDSLPVKKSWPWGNHHTAALGHLEAAAQRHWVNYDPSDATTAPTNATVSSWLQTERQVSRTMADSIASMLRPDGLSAGPRK